MNSRENDLTLISAVRDALQAEVERLGDTYTLDLTAESSKTETSSAQKGARKRVNAIFDVID